MFVLLKKYFYICKPIVNKMNTRLQQFLNAENISQAQFADTIGVARASISHILAGRNKPGFDFIERMAGRYPSLNLEWLITGKGKMYKGESPRAQTVGTALELWPAEAEPEPPVVQLPPSPKPARPEANTSANIVQKPVRQRNISKIVVFYDDGTFQELK